MPRVCPEPGCPELDCATHRRKPWAGSTRRSKTKRSGWEQQRRAKSVLRKHGYICHVCGQFGADTADHVIPLAHGGADKLSNLRPIHAEPCHREKTAREAAGGRAGPPPQPYPLERSSDGPGVGCASDSGHPETNRLQGPKRG